MLHRDFLAPKINLTRARMHTAGRCAGMWKTLIAVWAQRRHENFYTYCQHCQISMEKTKNYFTDIEETPRPLGDSQLGFDFTAGRIVGGDRIMARRRQANRAGGIKMSGLRPANKQEGRDPVIVILLVLDILEARFGARHPAARIPGDD